MQAAFYGDDGIKVIAENFLLEFLKAYDGEDPTISRRALMQAYDDKNVSIWNFPELYGKLKKCFFQSTFTMTVQTLFEDGVKRADWPNTE